MSESAWTMPEARPTVASEALERLSSLVGGNPSAARDVDTLRAVLDSVAAVGLYGNPDGTSMEGETPIEDWALDALDAAVGGRSGHARMLIDRYWFATWEVEYDENGERVPGAYRSEYRMIPEYETMPS